MLHRCEEHGHLRLFYSIVSAASMLAYIALIADLVALSVSALAFFLVCWRMMSEVLLCLLALTVTILTFSSAISVLEHDVEDLKGIWIGVQTLLKVSLSLNQADLTEELQLEPMVFALVLAFMVLTIFYILNVFVAQLTCRYSALHKQMRGMAFLYRARIIVQTMPTVPPKTWESFKASMRFNERLEFNAGDVGLAGGVQVLEPASAHPTTVDRIKRYGGSTMSSLPWPAEEQATEEKGFERLEKLMRRLLDTIMQLESDTEAGTEKPDWDAQRQTGAVTSMPQAQTPSGRFTRFDETDPMIVGLDEDEMSMSATQSGQRRPSVLSISDGELEMLQLASIHSNDMNESPKDEVNERPSFSDSSDASRDSLIAFISADCDNRKLALSTKTL